MEIGCANTSIKPDKSQYQMELLALMNQIPAAVFGGIHCIWLIIGS